MHGLTDDFGIATPEPDMTESQRAGGQIPETVFAITLIALALPPLWQSSAQPLARLPLTASAQHHWAIAVLLIAVYGFFDGRPEFLDIALLYALINSSHDCIFEILPLRHFGRSWPA